MPSATAIARRTSSAGADQRPPVATTISSTSRPAASAGGHRGAEQQLDRASARSGGSASGGTGRAARRCGAARFSVPPRRAPASASTTWWPRSASRRATSSPAGPPPTTSTRRGVVGGRQRGLVAVGGRRVGHAAHRLVQEDVADAAVLVDARPHVVDPARGQLVGQVGVGEQLAAHGDEVGVARGQRRLGDVGLDAPDGDHRHRRPVATPGAANGSSSARLVRGVRLGHAEGGAGVGGRAHVDGVGAGRLGQRRRPRRGRRGSRRPRGSARRR